MEGVHWEFARDSSNPERMWRPEQATYHCRHGSMVAMDHDVLADAQAEWVILHNHVMSADLGSPSATSRHALEQRHREREHLRIVNLEDHILRRRVGRVGGSTTTREHPPSSNAGSDVEVD